MLFEPTEKTDDERLSERLQLVLSANGKMPRKAKPSTWPKAFAQLRSKYGRVRVWSVLEWYGQHLHDPYMPAAYSATAFAQKFKTIERKMPPGQGGLDEWSDDFINTRLDHLSFTDMAALGAAVTTSSDRLSVFYEELRRISNSWERKPRRKQPYYARVAIAFLEENHFDEFMVRWFEWVHARTRTWLEWSGSFEPFLFHARHERMYLIGRRLAIEVCDDPTVWTTLLTEIKA